MYVVDQDLFILATQIFLSIVISITEVIKNHICQIKEEMKSTT